ncbi:bifunctional riboflavin kinase/FAD synthetase [Microterricola viridarii]|uniref:Riboflavin biosynthesis protein n=1 Tax=Microterricola viridarii TaxID=412690 RepID=A0A1H1SE64_9MICO|nr:bifunctional riboflavin kinase/FAD synthetase [Microterricola viridarii]SDS46211.1 riboflavin kinase / FMN adenylyltransferase [Microterricola viridarii]
MQIFSGIAEVPSGWRRSAVSIGKFDGVHAGHRALIDAMLKRADADALASVAVTFDRNPLEYLAPEKCPKSLVSTRQKLDLLAETGVDATVVLAFDETLANQPPEDFVRLILVDALHAAHVLIGRDFRFGAKGAGDAELLRALGAELDFTVEVIDDVHPDGDRRISSTWIRELLADGDVAGAGRLLGHIPTVRGEVVHGAKRGRELGFPTANLTPDSEGLVPADGVYAGWLVDEDGVRYPAAISVGNNPTFEGVPQKQVEAYVIDEELDLYGHEVQVEFAERIRGMVAFTGIEPLIRQMADDVVQAKALLA